MSKLGTALEFVKHDKRGFLYAVYEKLNKKGLLNWVSDKAYLKAVYWLRFGEKLNLSTPVKYNEKLQWLKLYDHRPEYITMVDKLEMKKYVSEKIGENYVIPTLGTWVKPEDIVWDSLPNQFVLKWNHDSGSIVICKNKDTFDRAAAIEKLRYGAKVNGFWYGREWPYKGVKPLLLAEPYLEDSKTHELRDYKVFAFNGVVKMMLIASDRQKKGESVKFDYFDINGNQLNIVNDHPQAPKIPELPQSFKKMIELTEKLSQGFPHLRVDFYEVEGRIYIGEFTFYHGSGLMSWKPDEWNYKLGNLIDLPGRR